MKSAGKARSNGLYRHIRTSKEIIRNLLNDYSKILHTFISVISTHLYRSCKIRIEFYSFLLIAKNHLFVTTVGGKGYGLPLL